MLCPSQVLHAVELRTPEYLFRAGTWFSRGTTGQGGRQHPSAGEVAVPGARTKREPIIQCLVLEQLEYQVCVIRVHNG